MHLYVGFLAGKITVDTFKHFCFIIFIEFSLYFSKHIKHNSFLRNSVLKLSQALNFFAFVSESFENVLSILW
uniref:Uncharacterized protein n=1 Tax=Octopus bimaculoides TaxID=37653 RepID=A0A0L8GVV0_OCTBM